MSAVPRAPLREEDLYAPVKALLEKQGFKVRGEVLGIDVLAVREESMVAVELKTTLNLDLVLQAVARQRTVDAVYVAVPRKGRTMVTKRWQELLHLLRRLEVGLVLVTPTTGTAEVLIEAVPYDRADSRRQAKRKRAALLKEFEGRKGDRNKGGVNRRGIYTVYRQMAEEIARLLAEEGPCSVRRLRELGAEPTKVMGILHANHYHWFEHLSRDLYGLSEKGRKAIAP
jgi:hypothetical protein